jgi:hypothetical protein
MRFQNASLPVSCHVGMALPTQSICAAGELASKLFPRALALPKLVATLPSLIATCLGDHIY